MPRTLPNAPRTTTTIVSTSKSVSSQYLLDIEINFSYFSCRPTVPMLISCHIFVSWK